LKIHEFRERVRSEFGPRLERATPASARDFLVQMQTEVFGGEPAREPRPVVMNESARSYDEVFSDFFNRVLELPAEQAVILLWLLAFELHFARVEEQTTEAFSRLLRGVEES